MLKEAPHENMVDRLWRKKEKEPGLHKTVVFVLFEHFLNFGSLLCKLYNYNCLVQEKQKNKK